MLFPAQRGCHSGSVRETRSRLPVTQVHGVGVAGFSREILSFSTSCWCSPAHCNQDLSPTPRPTIAPETFSADVPRGGVVRTSHGRLTTTTRQASSPFVFRKCRSW